MRVLAWRVWRSGCTSGGPTRIDGTRDSPGVTIVRMSDFRLNFDAATTVVAVRLNVLREVGALLRALESNEPPVEAVLVTDRTVAEKYGEIVLSSLRQSGFETLEYRIEPGEQSKSLAVAQELYAFLAKHHVGREATIVALGGGVVSDLAGFVAATWMRGVRFAICPTTLEADVDASIGGKTAVNLEFGKNLVGAFHQPILVAVDPVCLQSLSMRDVRAGLGESVKHALIASESFLTWHEENVDSILRLDGDCLNELILRNLRIKGDIVQKDTTDRTGLRALLNFGHTIGHAIESCGGFALRHGECVGLGMIAAGRLSQTLGLLHGSVVLRTVELLARLGLPTKLAQPIEEDAVVDAIRLDKKRRTSGFRFVLLEDVGRPVIRDQVPEECIRSALASLQT